MAAGTLVLNDGLKTGVHNPLMAHFGAPERIMGAVGHHGAPPVIDHVHIGAAVVHHGERGGIVAMAAFTVAAGHEIGVLTERQQCAAAPEGVQFSFCVVRVCHRAAVGPSDKNGYRSDQHDHDHCMEKGGVEFLHVGSP